MTTEEGTFKTRDGTSLYTKTWKPSSPSPLHLIFLHGFSDHINAYYNLFPTLSSPPYNITVHGFDQRGWGRSVQLATHARSARGLTGDTPLVLSDIHDFVIHASKGIAGSTPTPKLFLMGHSMGGAEALLYTLTSTSTSSLHSGLFSPATPLPLSGLALEAPHIAFPPTSQPSNLLVVSGRLAAKFLPNMQMVQKLESSAMCRDPKVCKDWEADELCHDTGTLRGLAGLLDRAACLDGIGRGGGSGKIGALKVETELNVPVFWGHGTEDRVCSFEASKRLYGVIGKKSEASVFKGYEGGYHKIHGEPDGMGEAFARDVGRWILGIAGVSSSDHGKGQTSGSGMGRDMAGQEQQQASESMEAQGAAAPEDPENVKSRL